MLSDGDIFNSDCEEIGRYFVNELRSGNFLHLRTDWRSGLAGLRHGDSFSFIITLPYLYSLF